MNTAKSKKDGELYSNNMGVSVFLSIAFHVLVFVMASVAFPHFANEIEPVEVAISVELADLAEISQTNKLDKAEENDDKEKKPPSKPKPVYNNTESVPDLLSPRKPEAQEDIPKPPKDKKDKPKPDESIIKKPPKPKNKPRIKKPKPTAKPAPKPKPVDDKKPAKPKDEKDFTSLLKSLTPDEPKEQLLSEPEQTPEKPIQPEDQGQISQLADFSKQMTRSELDDLNRGVEPCWNVNAGGKNAHSLIVELLVFVNQDRTVREVQIIDQMRYSGDTHFRAAAEAARRALLNPNCSTLNLPPEKYEQWKKFKYIFDPSNML